MKIKELMELWLNGQARERVKPRTFDRYKDIVYKHIIPTLGDQDADTVDKKTIQNFINGKVLGGNISNGRGLSSSSINIIICVLRGAFDYGEDIEEVTMNPCYRLKRAQVKRKKIEAFSKIEQKRLERAISYSKDNRLFGIKLCLYTGLRIGELLALKWEDIDLVNKLIRITKSVSRVRDLDGDWKLKVAEPKSYASIREIPIARSLVYELDQRCARAESEYVVSNKDGSMVSARSYQYMFQKLLERNGMRVVGFHSLRHTFATRILERGIDFKTLSELMGHENPKITMEFYAHSMWETKIKAMEKLNRHITL